MFRRQSWFSGFPKVVEKRKIVNATVSLQSLTYPGGAREEYTYTSLGQIETLINRKADGTIIDQYSYAYDDAGNLTHQIDAKGNTTYTYDDLNRLTCLDRTVAGVLTERIYYTYDNNGNQLIRAVTENGTVVENVYIGDGLRVARARGDGYFRIRQAGSSRTG